MRECVCVCARKGGLHSGRRVLLLLLLLLLLCWLGRCVAGSSRERA